ISRMNWSIWSVNRYLRLFGVLALCASSCSVKYRFPGTRSPSQFLGMAGMTSPHVGGHSKIEPGVLGRGANPSRELARMGVNTEECNKKVPGSHRASRESSVV